MNTKCGICEGCDKNIVGNCIFCKNNFCGDGGSRYVNLCDICFRDLEKKKACENSWLGIPLPQNLVENVPKKHKKNDLGRICAAYLSHLPESSEEKVGGGGGK